MRVSDASAYGDLAADTRASILDLAFHWEDEKTYIAVYGDQPEIGYERESSHGQDTRNDYTTSYVQPILLV
jgi:hypothetical protein